MGLTVAAPAHTVPPSIKGQFTTILGHLQLASFSQVRLKQATKMNAAKVRPASSGRAFLMGT